MKLSIGIAMGAMLKPQGFGYDSGLEGAITSCALNAAAEAEGCKWEALFERHPYLRTQLELCPVCDIKGSLSNIIALHLNDRHRWSRERIADWVATIEPQEELATPAVLIHEEENETLALGAQAAVSTADWWVAERIADKIIAEACGRSRFAVELSQLDIAELEAK